MINILQLFAAFADSAAKLILAMRLQSAGPEAPWFIGGDLVEKITEVAGVVIPADRRRL